MFYLLPPLCRVLLNLVHVWNIDTGSCEHTIENAHDGSVQVLNFTFRTLPSGLRAPHFQLTSSPRRVQCLTKLESGSETKASLFCSGGNDLHLKVWEFSSSAQTPPVLLGSMERQEEESTLTRPPSYGLRLVFLLRSSLLSVSCLLLFFAQTCTAFFPSAKTES